MLAITTKETVAVKLSPALKQQVREHLAHYARLATQRKALVDELLAVGTRIEEAFARAKEEHALDQGVEVNGFKLKRVTSTTSRLDIDYLTKEFGVTAGMLEAVTVTKPRRPYLKITAPGTTSEE